jgi:apolipoprotein D and lipocalin family protein
VITTVSHLHLDRYLGTWFEICRLPLKWEDEHASDITATYSLDPDG